MSHVSSLVGQFPFQSHGNDINQDQKELSLNEIKKKISIAEATVRFISFSTPYYWSSNSWNSSPSRKTSWATKSSTTKRTSMPTNDFWRNSNSSTITVWNRRTRVFWPAGRIPGRCGKATGLLVRTTGLKAPRRRPWKLRTTLRTSLLKWSRTQKPFKDPSTMFFI